MTANRYKRSLSSTVLLGVFLITLLHSAVPHYHHDHNHGELHVALSDLSHSHGDSHTHSHESSADKWNKILDLFGHHTHAVNEHDQVVLIPPSFEKNVRPLVLSLCINNWGITVSDKIRTKTTVSQFVKPLSLSAYPRSLPLRGPPTCV